MSGNKAYEIEYLACVLKDDIPHLATTASKFIKRAIEERLKVDPLGFGKPLRYSLSGHRSLRVGDYRIIYRIEPSKHTVLIIAIKHRKDVYSH
ncbi:MAG TPA: type II toxin-antitoxin system RelE/ParE family toxin [Opitutales bacterium]|nr:type II toxin-antitoxin system RelE/ParE family toxin [Opitutales bacterium]